MILLGFSADLKFTLFRLAHKKGGGGVRCGHNPKGGGGLRCRRNQKKGGLRHVYNQKKEEFRTGFVKSAGIRN